ncbi:hypothetical protein RZS08_47770, partial [Arthrospira platensis SPKY1]|nr:hypothetical protein [Arthrospira platensis SPKY1]
ELGLQVVSPLWVLLGLYVIGGKGVANEGHTSDVRDVLLFLRRVLDEPGNLAADLESLQARDGDADLLPKTVRANIANRSPEDIAQTVLCQVFGWQPGAKPVFRLLRAA